jgi:hypothetical protein
MKISSPTCRFLLVMVSLLALPLGMVQLVQAQSPGESASSTIPQVEYINQRIRAVWSDYEISPSVEAQPGEWCRRVYLDILGRVPTVAELEAFVNDTSPDKKDKLVTSLLYDDRYIEEYARNFTNIWTNILIGRSGGTGDDAMANRAGMKKYLRDSFARNKPYDRMVHELVTATGSVAPGSQDYNGAANFLIDKLDEGAALATADTAKIFLGLQVQCTQCHNHPFNEWKQKKFWEMNAFFRQTRALGAGMGADATIDARLINQDFAGEGNDPSEAEIYYELRNGLLQVAYPVFVDDQEISKSGYLEDIVRREELGNFIVESQYMTKSLANRMWGHFLGYGFTKPVDDMGPHNPPTHPELLDYLGAELRKNSFNTKELIRWIALSEAYGLSSKYNSTNQSDDPLMGETPKFSHFYLRQMTAEQLYESLVIATAAEKTTGSYEEQEKTKQEWLNQFVIAFGNDEGLEATTFNGTIPQALMLFNGDLIKKATSNERGSFLAEVANSNLSAGKKIEYLYKAGLARKPSSAELSIANKLLVARGGDTVAALQDMWWAILNSNEFIMVH